MCNGSQLIVEESCSSYITVVLNVNDILITQSDMRKTNEINKKLYKNSTWRTKGC